MTHESGNVSSGKQIGAPRDTYNRLLEQGSHQSKKKKKKESSLEESKSSGETASH